MGLLQLIWVNVLTTLNITVLILDSVRKYLCLKDGSRRESNPEHPWFESLFLPHNIQIYLFPAWDKMLLVISVFIGDREENEKQQQTKKLIVAVISMLALNLTHCNVI